MAQLLSGKMINSVSGSISVNNLGLTLVHEHVIVKPQINEEKYEPYTLVDETKAIEEYSEFTNNGGKTIIDLAPINYGRDVDKLEEIAKQINGNILFVTGFHKEEFMPNYVANSSIEDLTNIIMAEINNGVGNNKRKPALIKCGSSYNTITGSEIKAIKAVARAHKKSNLPITTHCDKGTMALEQLSILKQEGVDLSRVIVGHVDLKYDVNYLLEVCEQGGNVEIDHFGRGEKEEITRIKMLRELINNGYTKQIFISGDMGKKDYWKVYNGKPGISYFVKELKDIIINNFNKDVYEQIMINNPKEFFERS